MLINNFNQTFDNSKDYLLIYLLMETSLLVTSIINKRSPQKLAKASWFKISGFVISIKNNLLTGKI